MNYIGSKYSLLGFLGEVFDEVADDTDTVFCDLFAGTGAVGRYFKEHHHLRIIANDLQHYAYVLNKAYISLNRTPAFATLRKEYRAVIAQYESCSRTPIEALLAFVNGLPSRTGFITRKYSLDGGRYYFTKPNARKADAIRIAIESWKDKKLITENEFIYLLCSLLEAVDQVANTASVYGAYLKDFKASALKPVQLRPLKLSNHVDGCVVHQCDANELIKDIKCDVLYLDPPYNHRQYGANYHVLETIAAYDSPELRGVTGMRNYVRSKYCQSKAAHKALQDLVANAKTKHILLSYNDEGLLKLDEIEQILSQRGIPKRFDKIYNRFKADNDREYKRDSTVEYVHYVRVIH